MRFVQNLTFLRHLYCSFITMPTTGTTTFKTMGESRMLLFLRTTFITKDLHRIALADDGEDFSSCLWHCHWKSFHFLYEPSQKHWSAGPGLLSLNLSLLKLRPWKTSTFYDNIGSAKRDITPNAQAVDSDSESGTSCDGTLGSAKYAQTQHLGKL